ncbi:peptidase inhibitor family I36 protein [Janibacter sp. G349]|uniref:peptidase inhibitor family I36 protein n=1 Tax=unclassified Janibacter TaxID=2649294 RepID=UPI003B766620
MKRITTTICVAAALTITPAVASSADTASYSDCPSGNFCVWTGGYATGDWWGSDTNARVWNNTLANNDDTAYNNGTSGLAVLVYDGGWYNDPHYCLKRGARLTLPDNKDNDGESHQWMTASSAAAQAPCLG